MVSGKKKKEKKVGNFFASVYRQYSRWMDGRNLYKVLSICFVRLLHTERGCRPCKRGHYIIRILLMLREKKKREKNERDVCVLSCAKVDYMKEDHKTFGPMSLRCVCWVM